jgi:DNA-binding CsgD family transcriptional regulator/PAS domain-containing protein
MKHPNLIDRIYGVIADPAQWSDVIVAVADHLHAIGGMVSYHPPPGRQGIAVLGRLSPELLALYWRYHDDDLWTRAMKRQPFARVVDLDTVVEPHVLRRTANYADVLAPQGIEHGLGTSHRALARDGGVGGFGFFLSARARDDVRHHARRLQRLLPHLARALDVTMQLGGAIDGARPLARVLAYLPGAALLLDDAQRIVHANPAAEALLRARDGLVGAANGSRHLAALLPDENAALARSLGGAIALAAGESDQPAAPVRITRASGAAPLLVVPVPLPPPAFALWELTGAARVLVLVIDPAAAPRAASRTLQQAYGLTAAEARVAALIGTGLGGPQAARALGVSPSTVKTHLDRAFDKIGVRSQVALARMIALLPDEPAA